MSDFLVRILWTTIGAACLLSCGGKGDNKDPVLTLEDYRCAIEVELSGEVDHEIPLEDVACAIITSFDTGASAYLLPVDGTVSSVSLDIDEIAVEEVGVFPATVTLMLEDERRFVASECTVDVVGHVPDPNQKEEDRFGDNYLIHGTGSCTGDASSTSDPEETITLSDFQFAAVIAWGG